MIIALCILVPAWAMILIACAVGAFITSLLIGPPQHGVFFIGDIFTPMVHLVSWLLWIIVALVGELILAFLK